MQSVQGSEVFHTEPCREIGSEPTEGFRGPDRIREPRIGRDALLVERVGKKIALLEVEGDDRPVRDEIGEPHEAGSLPCGEVLRLRDVLALESRDTQHIDPPKGVERHHPHEAVDRLLQQIRRRQVELADLDAPAHLPDLRHPDEVPVLHEGEEPTLPVAARDLGPQGLRPGIQERQHADGIGDRLARGLP